MSNEWAGCPECLEMDMTPTYEQYKLGATTWAFTHEGVRIQMKHHGVRDEPDIITGNPHPGIWCYYIFVPEQMYPHRWQDFSCSRSEHGYEEPGPAFKDDYFDTGITWSSSEPYWDRKTGRQWDASKVGCDYAHLWHSERGYPDGYEDVQRDAKLTAEKFIKAHPDCYLRCAYTGIWAEAKDTYTARNGATAHISVKDMDVSPYWHPETTQ